METLYFLAFSVLVAVILSLIIIAVCNPVFRLIRWAWRVQRAPAAVWRGGRPLHRNSDMKSARGGYARISKKMTEQEVERLGLNPFGDL